MNKIYGKTAALIAVMLMAGMVLLASTPEQRKARRLVLKGYQATVQHDVPESYELFKRAYQLDPNNMEAAYSFGISKIGIASDTTEVNEGLGLMRKYVEAYPADQTEVENYAYLCRETGKVDEAMRVMKRLSEIYPEKSDMLTALAELSSMKGDMQEARDYYTAYERLEGPSPAISLRRIALWLYEKDTLNAIHETDRLIESQPELPDYQVMKGNLFQYLNQPDSALYYYNRALAVHPDDGGALLALANYYQENKDSVAYDKAIYNALLCDDIDLEVKLEMLADYITPLFEEQANTTHADYLLKTLSDQYPHEAQIQDFNARYSAAKGDWKGAVEHIQVAIDMEPDNDTYKTQKLSYLVAQPDYDAAIREYESLLDTTRIDQIDVIIYGIGAYTGAKQDDKAFAEASRILKLVMPNKELTDTLTEADFILFNERGRRIVGSVYGMIGDIKYREKDYAAMRLSYDNALTADPTDAMAMNNYAYFLTEIGDNLDKALELSAEAKTLSPDNATILDTYAWVLFKRGDYKEALVWQKSAMEKAGADDLSYDLYDHYGDILFMNGQPKEALEQWRKALELEPENKLLQKKVKYKTYFYE